jgi:hypothetical protein
MQTFSFIFWCNTSLPFMVKPYDDCDDVLCNYSFLVIKILCKYTYK